MNGGFFSHLGRKMIKSEIKPGYVLNEDLAAAGGMKQGRVLTYSDIEALRADANVNEIHVLTLAELSAAASGTEDVKTKTSSPAQTSFTESDYNQSMYDPYVDSRIKHNVEIKKSRIRGSDYSSRLEGRKQAYSNKFENSLKTVYAGQKISVLESIDHQSRSETDFEGIQSVEGLPLAEMLAKMRKYESNAAMFMDAALNEKRIYTSLVEEIVTDMIGDMGYHLQLGLLASCAKSYRSNDFLASHSLQVMLVSIVSAIELTRIMADKADKAAKFTETDIETLISMSRKSFTLDEMIQLGVAALLHDISLRKEIPGLSDDSEITIQQDSILQLHPSNSYHIVKALPIDYEIQRAVYQHHERFDGTGYPSAISPRFYTKFTPALMFAEYYIEQTTRNPFVMSPKSPRSVLVDLLSRERIKFDGDVVYAFLYAASLFPVGSWVMLSDERIGLVIDVNRSDLAKPIVKVMFDRNFGQIDLDLVDLSRSELCITKPVDSRLIQQFLHKSTGDYYIQAVAS